MEVQQTPLYIKYVQSLGWSVVKIEASYVIFKRFPFIGTLAKLQRPSRLPSSKKFITLLNKLGVRTFAPEPDANVHQENFTEWLGQISQHVKIAKTPFLNTKTIRVDLSPKEEDIFKRFTEAKRRAVRRAIKNDIRIVESNDIDLLIKIKNKSAGLFGFITTHGTKNLWPIFAPDHADILLAYTQDNQLVGGVLVLFIDNRGYYWIAGASKKGKKLFVPTLLVWEALKLSKKRGCGQFDLVGVWDERLGNQFTEWKGFTKFKEGFGGSPLYYPIARLHK